MSNSMFCRLLNHSARVFLLLTAASFISGCFEKNKRYATWNGIEPDKWASIWLIKRYIDPDAKIVLRRTNSSLDDSISFGTPSAQYGRQGGLSTFESLVKGYQVNDPVIARLGRLINIIEVSGWSTGAEPEADMIEQSYRYLQESLGREQVPSSCYASFFDATYQLLSENKLNNLAPKVKTLLASDECLQANEGIAEKDYGNQVDNFEIKTVLTMIAEDKKVVFVDTRETKEYEESHIPGAVNIKLREVNHSAVSALMDADLVISYCVKDFRGYEVARAIKGLGVENSGIMNPYGIAGWRSKGLPLSTANGMDDEEATAELIKCALKEGTCI